MIAGELSRLDVGERTSLEYAFIAATSFHLLIFGCIGLIPTPMVPLPNVVPSRNDIDPKTK
jgi:hypothetical protein